MTKKISVLFFLFKAKMNKRKEVPIYCRLTLNKKRRQFSTGFFILIDQWDAQGRNVLDSHSLSLQINQRLSSIRRKILDITLKHEVNEYDYTLDEVWNEITGNQKENVKGLLQVFTKHNEEMERLVGKTHSLATVKKFKSIYNQTKEFLRLTYQQDDIMLSNLKLKFLLDLEHYLHEKNMKQISINKTIQRVRKIVRYGIAHEHLDKDPFMLYKPKSVRIEVVYLSPEELSNLENYEFDSDRLTKVRDCFVFCCYTGLPYREMADLREHHIRKGFDGKDWIKIQRVKTQKPLMIPILSQAAVILERYKSDDRKDGALLPVYLLIQISTSISIEKVTT